MVPAEGGANQPERSAAASLEAANVPAMESIMAEYSSVHGKNIPCRTHNSCSSKCASEKKTAGGLPLQPFFMQLLDPRQKHSGMTKNKN